MSVSTGGIFSRNSAAFRCGGELRRVSQRPCFDGATAYLIQSAAHVLKTALFCRWPNDNSRLAYYTQNKKALTLR
jgi:hypothetical protein